MSGVKHTLHIEEGANNHFFDGRIRNDEGRCVAFVDLDAPVSRIFAAAPDLLEAGAELQAARKAQKLSPSAENLSRVRIASDAFDAAIARARGEQDGGGE